MKTKKQAKKKSSGLKKRGKELDDFLDSEVSVTRRGKQLDKFLDTR